jgi:hypothetical protein
VNRSEAAARVDELLELGLRAYEDGRCPHCEVLLLPPRQTRRAGEVVHYGIAHEDWCPFPEWIRTSGREAARLVVRFGLRYEPVVVELQPGVAYLTHRRVEEGAASA